MHTLSGYSLIILTNIYTCHNSWLNFKNIKLSKRRQTQKISLYDLVSIQSRLTLCHPMDCNTPGLPVHHQLLELTQTHVHWVSDTIQPFHPLSLPSPPTFNLSQHQDLFKWVSSSHQVAKVLKLQLQSFQWIFRADFL